MNYLIYCILVMLPIYTDSPLGLIFGASGYSILTSLSLIMMAVFVLTNKKIFFSKTDKNMFMQTLLMVIGSIVGVISWLIISGSITEYGENLIIKSFKVVLNYISYPSYLFLLTRHMKNLSLDKISRPIVAVLVFLTGFSIVEYNNLPYAFETIHFNSSFPYYRVRLLTTESSFTASIIIVYFAISCFYFMYKNNYLGIVITILCVAILMANTTSKSLMICFILMIAICAFSILKSKRKSKFIYFIGISIILLTACFLILPNLKSMIEGDLKSYTSTATRVYTFITAFLTGLVMPIGAGGAYLGFLPLIMKKFLKFYEALPFNFNTLEIRQMLSRNTDFAVSTSSGFMQFHMYWGIVGSILFYRNIFNVVIKLKKVKIKGILILLSAIYVLIAAITFSLPLGYDFMLLFAICNYLTNKFKTDGGLINEDRN